MAVASYRRSCGCTSLEFNPQPIAPGDARQVTLTFDSRGEWGWQVGRLWTSRWQAHSSPCGC
ncbi:MAG: DUF1573 domain-containing protein [Alistipes senegalensis]